MQIPRIKPPSCIGGESPMWDAISERLCYIDNVGSEVQSLDPAAGATTTLEMPGVPPSNEVATESRLNRMRAASMSSMELERGLPKYRYTGWHSNPQRGHSA